MKILVYGCGVIGSLLVHTLCRAGNEVTVVSKGKWGDVLRKNGLQIHHQLQHTDTVDHPRVAGSLPEESFDIVFSVMQGCQQETVLPELARADAPVVVLVGNNPQAAQMERTLQEMAGVPKTVLFGFQGTAGVRDAGSVNCLHVGKGSMTVGGLHRECTQQEKRLLLQAFQGTGYRLTFEDDMEGWLYCHAAFILPIVYISYQCGCDLRRADSRMIESLINAAEEGYGLIAVSGRKIRPAGDAEYFQSRPKRAALRAVLYAMGKTKLGELAATDHCRNAVTEMEWLDAAFEALRREYPNHPMPEWNRLRRKMPAWEELHSIYDAAPKQRTEKPFGGKLLAGILIAGTAAAVCYGICKRKDRS